MRKFLFEKQIDGEIPDNNVIVSIDYKILPPCGKCGACIERNEAMNRKEKVSMNFIESGFTFFDSNVSA